MLCYVRTSQLLLLSLSRIEAMHSAFWSAESEAHHSAEHYSTLKTRLNHRAKHCGPLNAKLKTMAKSQFSCLSFMYSLWTAATLATLAPQRQKLESRNNRRMGRILQPILLLMHLMHSWKCISWSEVKCVSNQWQTTTRVCMCTQPCYCWIVTVCLFYLQASLKRQPN